MTAALLIHRWSAGRSERWAQQGPMELVAGGSPEGRGQECGPVRPRRNLHPPSLARQLGHSGPGQGGCSHGGSHRAVSQLCSCGTAQGPHGWPRTDSAHSTRRETKCFPRSLDASSGEWLNPTEYHSLLSRIFPKSPTKLLVPAFRGIQLSLSICLGFSRSGFHPRVLRCLAKFQNQCLHTAHQRWSLRVRNTL